MDQVPDVELPRNRNGVSATSRRTKSRACWPPAEVPESVPHGDRHPRAQHRHAEGGDPRADLGARRPVHEPPDPLPDEERQAPRRAHQFRAVYGVLVALQPDAQQRAGLFFTRSADRAWSQIRTSVHHGPHRAEIKGFRFHDLSHTAASHMVMRGASLKDVQEILGHAD